MQKTNQDKRFKLFKQLLNQSVVKQIVKSYNNNGLYSNVVQQYVQCIRNLLFDDTLDVFHDIMFVSLMYVDWANQFIFGFINVKKQICLQLNLSTESYNITLAQVLPIYKQICYQTNNFDFIHQQINNFIKELN